MAKLTFISLIKGHKSSTTDKENLNNKSFQNHLFISHALTTENHFPVQKPRDNLRAF